VTHLMGYRKHVVHASLVVEEDEGVGAVGAPVGVGAGAFALGLVDINPARCEGIANLILVVPAQGGNRPGHSIGGLWIGNVNIDLWGDWHIEVVHVEFVHPKGSLPEGNVTVHGLKIIGDGTDEVVVDRGVNVVGVKGGLER